MTVTSSSHEATAIRRSVREFHDDFQELLKKTDVETLVVFVDDLDRCLPTTVIETLGAIAVETVIRFG